MLALIARATRRSRRGRKDDDGGSSRIGISQPSPSSYARPAGDNRNNGKAGEGVGLGIRNASRERSDYDDDGGQLDFIVPTTIVMLPGKFHEGTTKANASGGDVGTPATAASSTGVVSPPQPPSLAATDSSSPSSLPQSSKQQASPSSELLSPLTAATETTPGVGACDVDDVDAATGTKERHRRSGSRSWRSRLNRTRDGSRPRDDGHNRRSRSSGSTGGAGEPSGGRRNGRDESGRHRHGYGYGADYDYGHDDATIASMNSVPAYVRCPGVERHASPRAPAPSSSISGSSSVVSMPAAGSAARPARRSFSSRRRRNKNEVSSSRSTSPARSVHVGISQPEPLGSRAGDGRGGAHEDFILPTTVVMSSFLKTQKAARSSGGGSCCARSVSSCPAGTTTRDYGPSRRRGKNGSGGRTGDQLSSSSTARPGRNSKREAAGTGVDKRRSRRSSGRRTGRHDRPPAVIDLTEVFAADRRANGRNDGRGGHRGASPDDDDDNGSFERVRHRTVADDMMSVSSALSGRSASSSLASLIDHHTALFRDQPLGGKGKRSGGGGGSSARRRTNNSSASDTASLPGRFTTSSHSISESSSTRRSIAPPPPPPHLSRIFLLLLAPEDRKFELIQMKLHLKSSTVGDILDLIPTNSTERALGRQAHRGLCRPRDGVEMLDRDDPAVGERGKYGHVEGWRIRDGEVLLAMPEGYSGLACSRMSHQILNDPGVVKMLQREDPFAPKEKMRSPSSASMTSSVSGAGQKQRSSARSVQSTTSGTRRSKRSSRHRNQNRSSRSSGNVACGNMQSCNHVGICPRADGEESMPVEAERPGMPLRVVAEGEGYVAKMGPSNSTDGDHHLTDASASACAKPHPPPDPDSTAAHAKPRSPPSPVTSSTDCCQEGAEQDVQWQNAEGSNGGAAWGARGIDSGQESTIAGVINEMPPKANNGDSRASPTSVVQGGTNAKRSRICCRTCCVLTFKILNTLSAVLVLLLVFKAINGGIVTLNAQHMRLLDGVVSAAIFAALMRYQRVHSGTFCRPTRSRRSSGSGITSTHNPRNMRCTSRNDYGYNGWRKAANL